MHQFPEHLFKSLKNTPIQKNLQIKLVENTKNHLNLKAMKKISI